MDEACTATKHLPTDWSYRRHGCRCPATVAAHHQREQRRIAGLPHGYHGNHLRNRDRCFDPVALDRVVQGGEWLPLSPPERREAVRRLSRLGWSARRIAEHLRTTVRTVQRHRHALGHRCGSYAA